MEDSAKELGLGSRTRGLQARAIWTGRGTEKKQPNKSENVQTHWPKCATKAHYSFLRLGPLTEILTLLAATWANRSFNHSTSCACNTICGDTVPGTQQVAVRACYRVNASNGMGSITFHLSGRLLLLSEVIKVFREKGHAICNLLSNGSEKKLLKIIMSMHTFLCMSINTQGRYGK